MNDKRTTSPKRQKIRLNPRLFATEDSRLILGEGRRRLKLLTPTQLVRASITYFQSLQAEYERRGLPMFGTDPYVDGILPDLARKSGAKLQVPGNRAGICRFAEAADVDLLTPLVSSGTLQFLLRKSKYTAAIGAVFDELEGTFTASVAECPERYRPDCLSLVRETKRLRKLVAEALPSIVAAIGIQHPGVDPAYHVQAALAIIEYLLDDVFWILRAWGEALSQRRNGSYPQLQYVELMAECALTLFQDASVEDGCQAEAFKTVTPFARGDRFLAWMTNSGPATIPGAKGPIGAHLFMVPGDELEFLMLFMPLFMHEFGHNLLRRLENTLLAAVLAAIDDDYAGGKYNFSVPTVDIAGDPVPTIEVMRLIYGQGLSETAADIVGTMFCGDAFIRLMLDAFGAWQIGERSPHGIRRWIDASSVYTVDERGNLMIEPHLPDYLRAQICSSVLANCGLTDEAAASRSAADLALGAKPPADTVWRNAAAKSPLQFEIKVPTADLLMVAQTVIRAITQSPLQELGGEALGQRVNWSAKRQHKCKVLMQRMIAGDFSLPPFRIFPHYIGAACYSGLLHLLANHVPPLEAAQRMERAGEAMMQAFAEQRLASQPVPET